MSLKAYFPFAWLLGAFLSISAALATEIPVEAPSNIDPSIADSRDVQLVDWDLDGDLDVLAAFFSSGISRPVRLWRKQPPNWIQSDWPLGVSSATALAVGDVDGNGEPDFVYATGPDDEVVSAMVTI